MRQVGVLTGLAAEARLFQRIEFEVKPPPVRCAGADAARARRQAAQLIIDGAEALLSFGVAGGLDARLKPGDVVVGDVVRLPDGGSIAADMAWRASLLTQAGANGIAMTEGPIAGTETVVVTAGEKTALAARTGALVVDVESHALAHVAGAAGVPFVAVRAVADPAQQSLPRAVLGAVADDGAIRPLPVIARLLVSPWQVPHVVRLHLNTRAALAALGRLARLLGPALTRIP